MSSVQMPAPRVLPQDPASRVRASIRRQEPERLVERHDQSKRPRTNCERDCCHAPPIAVMHHHNTVVKLIQLHTFVGLLPPRPHHLQFEIPHLLAQGVAVDAQELSGADLIASGRGESGADEGSLDLAQDSVVKTGRR
jgi:hypothetical protein